MGAEVFHAGWMDGQTDVTKPIVAFRNFANAPKSILNQRQARLVVQHTVYRYAYCT